ncbi:hypothetical protein [Halobacillus sp. BBL2006]|uniref:hypothetical protein n=1 Tax=Halobacillus sp. BBL2006 TaxID=1543706 RepID=UPI000542D1E4|nr:hypothetical protein [Halobacillus sp. BBL2006]KHE73175.1 hypothetical protein LD39_00905 [Halobacillus sp. BBL2006]
MKAVEGMSSVVCFSPQDSSEERMNKFDEWNRRHHKEREERAFLGPVIPGPKETRAMLRRKSRS